MNEIIRDGGIKSRKLWYSVFSVVAMCVMAVVCVHFPALTALYGELVGGIVTVAGLYLAGNAATKLVGTKAPMETPGAAKPKAAALVQATQDHHTGVGAITEGQLEARLGPSENDSL